MSTVPAANRRFLGATYLYEIVDHPHGVHVLAITATTKMAVARVRAAGDGTSRLDDLAEPALSYTRTGTPIEVAEGHAELLANLDDNCYAF